MTKRVVSGSLTWICGLIVTFACSRSDDAPRTAGSTGETVAAAASNVTTDNACQLLTKSEAAAVLSSRIKKVGDEGAPFPVGTMVRSSCFYRGDDGGTVALTVNTYESAPDAIAKFARLKSLYSGGKTVPNLGEEAFTDRGSLVVRQSNRHLTLDLQPAGANRITDYSDAKAMDALLALERPVVARALVRLPAPGSTTVANATQTSGSGKSACAVVSQAEMEGILGGSLSHVVPSNSAEKTTCTYTGAEGRYAQVVVEWKGGEAGMAGTRLAASLMGGNTADLKVTTPVDGIGDEAVMLIGGVLNVRKGSALITVDLRMQENSEAKAKAIAQKVIASL